MNICSNAHVINHDRAISIANMQSLSDDSFVDELGKNHNGNYAAHEICANIPVTMSANSDKLISDFKNSWPNN